jgi:DNA helicase IV
MNPLAISAFDLPARLSPKADPGLINRDERHFAAIAESLQQTIAELSDRLDAGLRAPGGIGREAMDRDAEIHRLTGRLRALRRFGLHLYLGHIVGTDDPEPVYIGRLGLTDSAGRRLLLDWRSPAAEPFFAAAHASPMGLASRRMYRWTRGRISDYWDEVFSADGLEGHAALDDQSPFIASLGGNRSARMRDVLATIQADQDAVIRAGSRGALVVDGGPGTGTTVVALHPTSSAPTPVSVTVGAECCSSVRTSPIWPTSPMSCPAWERRAYRPARCGTSSPREPERRSRPTRACPC